MRPEEAIKLFGLNNLTIESDIQRLERELEIDLGHKRATEDASTKLITRSL